MHRKNHQKTTETMRSQSISKVAGKKRKAEEVFESHPRAHQETNATTAKHLCMGAQVETPGQPHNTGSHEVFRFLDLPAEIRNQIYEVIAEMSERSFPHTYPNRGLPREYEQRRPLTKPLPFIGLTQACVNIRKEFRPIWLSTHRFPLYSLAGYCKAFFPTRKPAANREAMLRLTEGYHNPAGTLRIWVTDEWPVVTDMLPFLKFRLRFPKYNFELVSPPQRGESEPTHVVSTLVNNNDATWTRYIQKHIITQVLIQGSGQSQSSTGTVRIVIKLGHAPDWMKKYVGHSRRDLDSYAERLGLGPISSKIGFGVDYS